MARRCSVCSRPDAGAINALLGEGRSARSVAVERGLSEDACSATRPTTSRGPASALPPVAAAPVHRHARAGTRSTSWSTPCAPRRSPATRPSSTSTGSPSRPRRTSGTPHRRPATSPASRSGSRSGPACWSPSSRSPTPAWPSSRPRRARLMPWRHDAAGPPAGPRTRLTAAPRCGAGARADPRRAGCPRRPPGRRLRHLRARRASALQVDHDHRHCPGRDGLPPVRPGLPCAGAATRALGRIGDHHIPQLLAVPVAMSLARRPPAALDPAVRSRTRSGSRRCRGSVGYLRETRPTVVLKGRQVGRVALSAAALAIHTVRYRPDVNVVIVSPSPQAVDRDHDPRPGRAPRRSACGSSRTAPSTLRLANGSPHPLPARHRPQRPRLDGAAAHPRRGRVHRARDVHRRPGARRDRRPARRPVDARRRDRRLPRLVTDDDPGWARLTVRSDEVPTISRRVPRVRAAGPGPRRLRHRVRVRVRQGRRVAVHGRPASPA